MKSVCVIVVNWRDFKSTKILTDSLLRLEYPNTHIIIVDNHSEDGSYERLKDEYPDLQVLENPSNNGYGGGINFAVSQINWRDFDYFLILNDDLVLETNSLTELVELAEKKTQYGIVSPKIKILNTNKIEHAGCLLNLATGKSILLGGKAKDVGRFEQDALVDYTGIGLIKKEVFQSIGFFDESYFLYCEDSDFCLRAKREGYFTVYAHKALFWNTNIPSRKGITYYPQKLYYITRNNLLLVNHHGKPIQIIAQLLLKTMGVWTYLIVFLRENGIRILPSLLRAYYFGIWDGLKYLIKGSRSLLRRY